MLGRFRLIRKLGEGGMGEVWLADDVPLGRQVALKLLARVSGSDLERFLREGKLAAQLDHPHIVRVYDMGVADGRHFISMQYIKGSPVDGRALGTRRTLEAIADIAGAIQYAHENGVVHRDIKPENLLMDESGRIYLTDFGLAKGVESSNLSTSRTGAVLGTPAYMSPEAARGQMKDVGPQSDVYSLGATLYDLLTGRQPFQGESFIEMLAKIPSMDPLPIRKINPKIAEDIETIVCKAMEKEPLRRYASAREFEADLRRFLAGEPIQARPPSMMYQFTRRVKKNPLAYLLAVTLSGGIVVALAIWVAGEQEARRLQQEQDQARDRLNSERAAALQMFRETARTSLEIALDLRRRGQNDAMAVVLTLVEKSYRRAIERSADLAEVEYLMGRMHRALMQDDKALEYQEKALAKDPNYAPSLYERAVLNSRKYDRQSKAVIDAMKILDAAPKEAQKPKTPGPNEIEKDHPELARLRQSIVRDLEKLTEVVSRQAFDWVSQANVLAAQGILASFERHWDQARSKLEEAVKLDPLMEEAWQTLGDIAHSRGAAAYAEEHERAFAVSERWYTQGHDLDKGYIPHLLGRGALRSDLSRDRWQRGIDPTSAFADAESDYSQVLLLDPKNVEALTQRGFVRGNRAFYLGTRAQDPLPDYAAAEKDLVRAVELDSRAWSSLMSLGAIRTNRALFNMMNGKDPTADLAAAERDCDEAIKLNPVNSETWIKKGVICQNRGHYLSARGKDPLPDYDLAIKHYTEALRLNRELSDAWMYCAGTLMNRGVVRRARGEDPLPDYAESERHYSEALRLFNGNAEAYMRRATLRTNRAIFNMAHGHDPTEDLKASEDDLARALQINPESADAYMRLAGVHSQFGNWFTIKNQDPLPAWVLAEEAATRSLLRNKGNAIAWKTRGSIYYNRADYLDRKKETDKAAADFAAALRDFTEALRINPGLDSQLKMFIDRARKMAKTGDY